MQGALGKLKRNWGGQVVDALWKKVSSTWLASVLRSRVSCYQQDAERQSRSVGRTLHAKRLIPTQALLAQLSNNLIF